MPTRRPGASEVTEGPSISTMPTISCPGTIGRWMSGSSPSTTCRSVRQTPQASTRTRTSPGPGSGSGRCSSVSSCPEDARTIAFTTRSQRLSLDDFLQLHDLFGIVNHSHGSRHALRIDADRVDPELRQKRRDAGIVGGRLAADADMPSTAMGARHRLAQHLRNAGVALVEVEGDDLRIAADAQ